MTTAALSAGCALLAFSPTLCLLFHLTYSKANLIIIVTTAAFAYLLSTVVSSLLWLPVPASLRDNPYLLIFPSIAAQFVTRAGFVWLYHKVEHSVERSVRRHQAAGERVRAEAAAARRRRRSSAEDAAANSDANANNDDDEPPASESAKLRLELNDWSSSLAAGTGYGGMHIIFLYGTLLASEANNVGTLYQPSCEVMPSLVNSAIVSHLFSLLDIVWMMWTFYGMRRRRDGGTFESEGGLLPTPGTSEHGAGGPSIRNPTVSFSGDIDIAGAGSGSNSGSVYHLANNKRGGNGALILVLVSHCAAALSTVPNAYENGCMVALPCLAGVAVVTGLTFWLSCAGHYLPNAQRRRQYERTASMAAEAAGAGAGARIGRYED